MRNVPKFYPSEFYGFNSSIPDGAVRHAAGRAMNVTISACSVKLQVLISENERI